MSIDLQKRDFDIAKFNKEFEETNIKLREEEEKKNDEKLKSLNTDIYEKKISEMTFNEILIDWKMSMLGVLNDLINFRWKGIIAKDNRLFHIGITLIICVILFYIFSTFFEKEVKSKNTEFHIYAHLDTANPISGIRDVIV